MEDHAMQPPSGSSAAAASPYPSWVMLERSGKNVVDASKIDVNTLASSRTSTGVPILISLSLAAPPASSRIRLTIPGGLTNIEKSSASAVAAHGDSLPIQVVLDVQEHRLQRITDYFVYNAGDAAAGHPTRPPSLLLLPPTNNNLFRQATGFLCHHGEDDDEVVVAELRIEEASKGQTPASKMAELFILRSGKWSVIQPPISVVDGVDEAALMSLWQTREVFPIGDRLLCWENMSHHGGIILSDVFDENPVLRYVPFPVEAEKPISGPDPYRKACIAPGGTVKFVNIFPRCCCGGAGASHCRLSHEVYVITTWTLRMGDMEWVKDGMVDATELWALEAYDEGIPRVMPSRSVVSMDDPNTICFFFRRRNVNGGGNTVWLAMVDMARKTIPSVACYQRRELSFGSFLSSRVSEFFNSDRSTGTSAASGSHKDDMATVDEPCKMDADDLVLQPSSMSTVSTPTREESKVSTPEETIFSELEKIPGLLGDNMLKAYSIFSLDQGRRFRDLCYASQWV